MLTGITMRRRNADALDERSSTSGPDLDESTTIQDGGVRSRELPIVWTIPSCPLEPRFVSAIITCETTLPGTPNDATILFPERRPASRRYELSSTSS
jgi:hypothetical protein